MSNLLITLIKHSDAEIKLLLEQALKACGTQTVLANKAGISQGLLNSYLTGKRPIGNMASRTLFKLAPFMIPHLKDFPETTKHPDESLEMTALLREKISVLEERLKLAAETTVSKNTIIHEKNRRINELEVELKKARQQS